MIVKQDGIPRSIAFVGGGIPSLSRHTERGKLQRKPPAYETGFRISRIDAVLVIAGKGLLVKR